MATVFELEFQIDVRFSFKGYAYPTFFYSRVGFPTYRWTNFIADKKTLGLLLQCKALHTRARRIFGH